MAGQAPRSHAPCGGMLGDAALRTDVRSVVGAHLPAVAELNAVAPAAGISPPPLPAWRRCNPVCRGSLRGKWPRRSVRRPDASAGGGGFSEAQMSCSSNSHGAGSPMRAKS